jgi:hypothetical protein
LAGPGDVVESQQPYERGPILILVLGPTILTAGIVRFLHLGHFTMTQAGYCFISTPAGLLLLLITDCTSHHARIVFCHGGGRSDASGDK